MIDAIIVDDEPYCCETLEILIGRCCPDLHVVAICNSGEEALTAIRGYSPQVVFLDIEMPNMNGFELLEKIPVVDFSLIFTTSYDHYAIQAIRFSALDYLLKPIDRDELQRAAVKCAQRCQHPTVQQLELLLQKMNRPQPKSKILYNKIALPTIEGLMMIEVNTIISCSSDSNYTSFMTKGGKKITVARTMKDVEELLEDDGFLRVHNSYLVNLNEITKYVRGEGGYLIMSDGSSIDVSRSRKETLLKRLAAHRL
jgi:two-component system LytT family response regulator